MKLPLACCTLATLVSLLTFGVVIPAASARFDPGSPSVPLTPSSRCELQRVGTQFVRCDNLTGAGVRAPLWIPER